MGSKEERTMVVKYFTRVGCLVALYAGICTFSLAILEWTFIVYFVGFLFAYMAHRRCHRRCRAEALLGGEQTSVTWADFRARLIHGLMSWDHYMVKLWDRISNTKPPTWL